MRNTFNANHIVSHMHMHVVGSASQVGEIIDV